MSQFENHFIFLHRTAALACRIDYSHGWPLNWNNAHLDGTESSHRSIGSMPSRSHQTEIQYKNRVAFNTTLVLALCPRSP
jgi:hypothetical protein